MERAFKESSTHNAQAQSANNVHYLWANRTGRAKCKRYGKKTKKSKDCHFKDDIGRHCNNTKPIWDSKSSKNPKKKDWRQGHVLKAEDCDSDSSTKYSGNLQLQNITNVCWSQTCIQIPHHGIRGSCLCYQWGWLHYRKPVSCCPPTQENKLKLMACILCMSNTITDCIMLCNSMCSVIVTHHHC